MVQDRLLFRCLTASFALHLAFVLGVPIRQRMADSSLQPRQIHFSHVKLITLVKPPPAPPKVEVSRQKPKAVHTVVRRRLLARRVARRAPQPEKRLAAKPPIEVAKTPEKVKPEPTKAQVAKLPEPKPAELAKLVPPVQVTVSGWLRSTVDIAALLVQRTLPPTFNLALNALTSLPPVPVTV